ncbi:MAG: thermonuclease family protein [Candidatus Andersenbacteria bacterium]|nr:thermonuclease family protein [Candidatus Andersenbacteria bacterium]MBI3250476.1 thermonuclease family protein [Candidatus Andersenbacteria bacterium]
MAVSKKATLLKKGLWLLVIIVAGYFILRTDNSLQPLTLPTSLPTPLATPVSTPTPTPAPTKVAGAQDEFAVVERVVDGDTVVLVGGRRVRYIGIDTPESVQVGTPVECLGKEASEKNKTLVEGKRVRLEKDVSETDRLGRLLRYIYVDDVFINDVLVREGFARASKYPPDVAYQVQLDTAEEFARQMKWGIWSGQCGATGTSTPLPLPSGDCTIKGNISSGQKIYHLPGCGSYGRTEIDAAQGEKYFCTEKEATEAGWRKAQNC